MTKPLKASEQGLKPHFKVRVGISGTVLYLASWDEPRVRADQCGETLPGRIDMITGSKVTHVEADWINDSAYGDTIGFIDWREVKAVTWRLSD